MDGDYHFAVYKCIKSICYTPLNYSSDGKESACSAEDQVSVPGWGRSPGEGNGNPLQYSCLENPMDRGAWQATVHGVAKSWTQLMFYVLTKLEEKKNRDLTWHLVAHITKSKYTSHTNSWFMCSFIQQSLQHDV